MHASWIDGARHEDEQIVPGLVAAYWVAEDELPSHVDPIELVAQLIRSNS
jgi:hypothetical protein